MHATSAPRAATSSTASYITTPGPVLHDISHVHCDGESYDNMFEINYNRQLTSSMNHDYASEVPARYLKHWGLLVDTGAYVSVAPKHFAPEVPLKRQQIKKWITTNGFANSMLQTDSEAAILQLGEHVSRELGLRFRASPPHSHQSNGAVERLHRTLLTSYVL